jgi:DNA-binding NarL/FixJ family response regulator
MRRLESEMTTKQKKLISMLEAGEKKKDIAAKLKTTNKIIKENQAFLKQQLNSHIKQVAAEKGIDIDYNEMLLYFEGC